jgi:hypothetical protein
VLYPVRSRIERETQLNWWYVSDGLGVVVFLPALVVSLARLIRPLRSIDGHLAAIVDNCNDIASSLDGLPGLSEAELLTGAGQPGIVRYSDALERAR